MVWDILKLSFDGFKAHDMKFDFKLPQVPMKNQTANLKSVLNKCLNTVQGSKTYKEKKERKNEHKKERKKERKHGVVSAYRKCSVDSCTQLSYGTNYCYAEAHNITR